MAAEKKHSLAPPAYSAGAGAAAAAGFGQFTVAKDPHDSLFEADQKPVDLGGGYEAIPIWQIRRTKPLSREEITRASLMNAWWTPKGADPNIYFAQRSPFISVDNFCMLYNQEMYSAGQPPQVIIGVWDKKNINIFGKIQNVRGLVLAGGGHVERMGDKNWRPEYYGNYKLALNQLVKKMEDGDHDLRSAADKELSEEIGIDRKNSSIVTQELGFMDDVFSDPRAHYLRCIFLRWIDQPPRPSEELRTIINVPLPQLAAICQRKIFWTAPDGVQLGLELNHDTLIRLIMVHPATLKFIEKMKLYFQSKTAAPGEWEVDV